MFTKTKRCFYFKKSIRLAILLWITVKNNEKSHEKQLHHPDKYGTQPILTPEYNICENHLKYRDFKIYQLHAIRSHLKKFIYLSYVDNFKFLYRNNVNKFKFKEFEIFLWKKRRFRMCRDSSPGSSISGRLGNRKTRARILAQSKASLFHRKISNSLH